MPPNKLDSGFVKADSSNLPKITIFMVWEYFMTDERYNVSEIRGVKATLSSRENYGDSAIGYVSVKRENPICTVKGRICPEHRVRGKDYGLVYTGIIYAICRGFIDSLKGSVVLFYMDKQINEKLVGRSPGRAELRKRDLVTPSPAKYKQRESMVLMRTIQCCALNGGVFWASILIFDFGLLPFVKYLLTIIFGHSPGMGLTVWSWIQPFLSFTFGTIWVLPLFLLSRIVNSLWFQDIADSAYRYRQGRPMFLSSVSKLIADMLFSVLVQALFLGQGMLVSKVPLPPLGDILALVHMCLLYALYAFEYKWFNMGWELHRRLTFIEGNWPYFLGFGMPLAVLTQLPNSYFVSGCVFSILFPLFIVSGNEAEPITGVCDCQLKLFSPVIAIANTLFNKTIGRANKR